MAARSKARTARRKAGRAVAPKRRPAARKAPVRVTKRAAPAPAPVRPSASPPARLPLATRPAPPPEIEIVLGCLKERLSRLHHAEMVDLAPRIAFAASLRLKTLGVDRERAGRLFRGSLPGWFAVPARIEAGIAASISRAFGRRR